MLSTKYMKLILFVVLGLTVLTDINAQDGVGIGTTDVNSDAILEVDSGLKGLLIPRMTTAQRLALAPNNPSNPANRASESLLVFDITLNAYFYYDVDFNDGVWRELIPSDSNASLNTLSMSGNINMNNSKVTNLTAGTANGDAVNRAQLNEKATITLANTKLPLSGGTMTGDVNMGNNQITNLDDGTADSHAVNLGQLEEATKKITWSRMFGSTSFTTGDKSATLDLGSSEMRTLDIVGWSDIRDGQVTIRLGSKPTSAAGIGAIIVQRNFRPNTPGEIVSQESMNYHVTTSNRYITISLTNGGRIGNYGIKARLIE